MASSRQSQHTVRELAIAGGSLLVVALTLVESIARLGARALAIFRDQSLSPTDHVIISVIVAVFWYGEGYRALQMRFVPHVVARAFELARSGRRGGALALGPLYVMSLVGDRREARLRAWLGVAAIVAVVLAVRHLPPFWRGAVDAGVSVALLWGLAALVVRFVQTVRGEDGVGVRHALTDAAVRLSSRPSTFPRA